MSLEKSFIWLNGEHAPVLFSQAKKLYGVEELSGSFSNPVIMGWAEEIGVRAVYTNTSIAWCGLTMAVVVKRAGYKPVTDPLWAKNWLKFGVAADRPSFGDIMVFNRTGGGGHVALYLAETNNSYFVLGGNQGNRVGIMEIPKKDFIAARRPKYLVKPLSVRPVLMNKTADGAYQVVSGANKGQKLLLLAVGVTCLATGLYLLYKTSNRT
jgi:uncharacterized protein (TIGR02594 family)